MMNLIKISAITMLTFVAATSAAAETGVLAPQLEPFRPLLGRTWRGEFKNSTPERPIVDVSRWERALNGQAIRILHSVNDGDYGGESLIVWDRERETLAYWYFTTAGFHTRGTMTWDGARSTSHEQVTGGQEGIAEVKSTTEILPDGRMHTKSQYLKDGEWVDGHEIEYVEAPDAEVRFK